MSTITFNNIKNQTNDLIKDFLNGKNLQIKLSDKIFKTFDINNDLDYLDTVNNIKQLLNDLTVSNFTKYNNFFILNIKKKLSNSELAVIVRFINICYNNNTNIIIINNNVSYVGNYFNNFNISVITHYIISTMNEIKFKTNIKKYKEKILSKLNNIFLYFSNRYKFKVTY